MKTKFVKFKEYRKNSEVYFQRQRLFVQRFEKTDQSAVTSLTGLVHGL
jgi:hypothetical protein